MSSSVAEINKDGGGPLVSLDVDVSQDIGSSVSDSETPFQKGKQIPQSQTTSSQNRADKQRNVPHFAAWENEEFDLTALFENTQKAKNEGTLVTDNELQMNRDITDLPVHAQSSVQTQTQARIKVPQFGDWEREGGEGSTVALDSLKKKSESKCITSQSNRDAPQEGRAKVPRFGAWEREEHVPYGAYFDCVRKKNTHVNYGRNPLIRDFVADRARPLPSIDDDTYGGGTRTAYDRRLGEPHLQNSNASHAVGGLTPEDQFPSHPEGSIPKQKHAHHANRTVKGAGKKGSWFRWFSSVAWIR